MSLAAPAGLEPTKLGSEPSGLPLAYGAIYTRRIFQIPQNGRGRKKIAGCVFS